MGLLTQHPNSLPEDVLPLLERLTLVRRPEWRDRSSGLSEVDLDQGRLDRRFSLINRPLLALTDNPDPVVLVAPVLVADAIAYSFSGLMEGSLNQRFWTTSEAVRFAGHRGRIAGEKFETIVAETLTRANLVVWPRVKLSWALNQKVDERLGDVDVLALNRDGNRVWVIEAKNLRLCRTEIEVASRLSEYRGGMIEDSRGREKPDEMLRHINRVRYLRENSAKLCGRLDLDEPPEVKGLLVVDAPQPMNFLLLHPTEETETVFLDRIEGFAF